ncbi:MAG: Gfo/Idh/MocA family protein [Clostridia bacterium]
MIRIGIVGAGAIAVGHKAAIGRNDSCCMAAVCDLVREKAEELAAGTDARIYTDYRDMQEKEQLDAVILNLPHFLHKDVSIYFLEHHIPTLVEKPMATSVAECDAMIAAAERTGTLLCVGHVQRYYKCHRYLRELVQENRLGRFCAMTETRNIDYFPGRPKWFLNKAQAGGGILMNYGAHTLDKLFYITGLSVNTVSARGSNFLTEDTVEATAQLLLGLSDGSSAALTYCGCHGPGQYDTYFYFTNGTVKIGSCTELWIAEGNKPLERVDLGDGTDELLYDQLLEFLKLLEGQDSEIVTPAYGRKVISVLEQAFNQFEA